MLHGHHASQTFERQGASGQFDLREPKGSTKKLIELRHTRSTVKGDAKAILSPIALASPRSRKSRPDLSSPQATTVVNLASPLVSPTAQSMKSQDRNTYGSDIDSENNPFQSSSSSDQYMPQQDDDQDLVCDRPTYEHMLSEEKEEPAPLVKSGIDLQPDMIHGWRPKTTAVIFGAPIPLHYNFDHHEMPVDPATQKPYEALYLGPRIPTSLQVHKSFANRNKATSAD